MTPIVRTSRRFARRSLLGLAAVSFVAWLISGWCALQVAFGSNALMLGGGRLYLFHAPGSAFESFVSYRHLSLADRFVFFEDRYMRIVPAGWDYAFPIWWVPILLLVVVIVWRQLERSRESRLGHCPNCGYDLRATPDRCPECGHAAAQ